MRLFKIACCFLFILFSISIYAQDKQQDLLNSFLQKFVTTLKTSQKQRTYLTTDKSVFKTGETIWFKAFLLSPVTKKAYERSPFLFVDLVNDRDTVVNTVIFDAADPQLSAGIVLPNTLQPGYYWMRAYTRQMAEEDANSIYVKSIYVFNKANENYVPHIRRGDNEDGQPVITFFPEGNNMITGVNTVVALQVSNKNGEAIIADGLVKNDRDSVIAHFMTNANGLAKFTFEPSGYRKYKATINWRGKEVSYPLPSFNFRGAQLSALKQTDGYTFRILLGDSIYSKEAVTYVVGVCRDSLIFASIGKGQYEVNVGKQNLAGGINTFYLLDKDFKLLSERSVYVHDKNIQVKIATDKAQYARRDKVSLDVSITDAQQHAIPSYISISVTDTLLAGADVPAALPGTACYQTTSENIFLARHDSLAEENTELLMLANNNTWPAMSNSLRDSSHAKADSLLYIKGVVLNDKAQPAANKKVTLVSKSKELFLESSETDSKGRFRFPLESYADSTEFMIEVKNADGSALDNVILRDALPYPKIKTSACLKQYLPIQTQLIKKYFRANADDEPLDGEGKLLQPVTVKSTAKTVNYDESKRISNNSVVLASDKINERNKVSDVIQMVGGVQVIGGFLVLLTPSELTRGIGLQSEPMLLINGVQAGGGGPVLQTLDALNPREIDFIEILKGPEAAIYGLKGGNGVINVNTRTRGRDINAGGSGIKGFYAKGVSGPVLFPNTGYDKKTKKATAVTDNRSTLYWSGNYSTDATNHPALIFYTSDIASGYRVTVTGITDKGEVIYKTMVIGNK